MCNLLFIIFLFLYSVARLCYEIKYNTSAMKVILVIIILFHIIISAVFHYTSYEFIFSVIFVLCETVIIYSFISYRSYLKTDYIINLYDDTTIHITTIITLFLMIILIIILIVLAFIISFPCILAFVCCCPRSSDIAPEEDQEGTPIVQICIYKNNLIII